VYALVLVQQQLLILLQPLSSKRSSRAKNATNATRPKQLREEGVSEVGHSPEAAALRHYQLRKKKRKGLISKREKSLTEVLFPGVTPELYADNEDVFIALGRSLGCVPDCQQSQR
jgi:hypothetical protein